MRGAALREKLQAGQVVLNVGLTFDSPSVVEMLGYAGADSIFLDAEHGSFGPDECEDMIRAADLLDKPAIVRVPTNREEVILRFLDVGASGIIAPHVSTRADAERAVRAVKYGPEGRRSFAGGRASAYGTGESGADYIRRANRETLVIGLFEDVAGLPNLTEILAVPGLDALIVGPNDLAFSMGYPADPWNSEVQKVVDQVIAACRADGKATGLPASDAAQARRHVERGCQIITMTVASILISSTNRLASELHEL